MDVMGRAFLADGREMKFVTGIDDHSRSVVCARVVVRATARPVCDALLWALRAHGVPEQILTDNGKVFTARFGLGPGPVLFDKVCHDNGIKHLLTAPYSPTTTGKVERLHKTIRAEFLAEHDLKHLSVETLQAALDDWVVEYNTGRPHQSCGGRPPAERFALADRSLVVVEEPAVAVPVVGKDGGLRPPGVSRWVDQRGTRDATTGLTVTRLADNSGVVSFAGATYGCGRAWARQSIDVTIVPGSVQLSQGGKVIRVHPIRHDRSRELGAFANPKGRPRRTAAS